MNPEHTQVQYSVRCEWGRSGALALARHADLVVVVDVLSFTTCVTVAVERGVQVYPYRFRDDRAGAFASERQATLAVSRAEAGPGQVSLSPSSIRSAPGLRSLVLPSPNGSTIVQDVVDVADTAGPTIVAASLLNASAVAQWVGRLATPSVAVIPAGERWPDGSLRPAAEDLWGAGAVIEALPARWRRSPEARLAAAAWRAVSGSPSTALRDCASGRELAAIGFGGDVQLAADVDTSRCVPVLIDGRFRDARTGQRPGRD